MVRKCQINKCKFEPLIINSYFFDRVEGRIKTKFSLSAICRRLIIVENKQSAGINIAEWWKSINLRQINNCHSYNSTKEYNVFLSESFVKREIKSIRIDYAYRINN